MSFEKNVYDFLKSLKKFDYKIEFIDRIWNVVFPGSKNKFHHIVITQYHDVFYMGDVDGYRCTLEIKPNGSVKAAPSFGFSSFDDGRHNPASVWDNLIAHAHKWLKQVEKNWIKANKFIYENYPFNRRYGTVPNSLIRASLADIYRIDIELGKAKIKRFIRLVEEGYFRERENYTRKSMSANDYFDYCKIAYCAGRRKDEYVDESLSGRELYQRYADGRHEGLLDIAANSKKQFADWIDGSHPKKTMGGHPWEIKRGGNTTHINLSVSRPYHHREEGFEISLSGRSFTRLRETICMFLAIQETGLPITINDPEGIRKRLLGQDNVGIVPCYGSLHRANQRYYEHQDVYDVLHYDDLGRYKRRITPFITWEPLPILKPAGTF